MNTVPSVGGDHSPHSAVPLLLQKMRAAASRVCIYCRESGLLMAHGKTAGQLSVCPLEARFPFLSFTSLNCPLPPRASDALPLPPLLGPCYALPWKERIANHGSGTTTPFWNLWKNFLGRSCAFRAYPHPSTTFVGQSYNMMRGKLQIQGIVRLTIVPICRQGLIHKQRLDREAT